MLENLQWRWCCINKEPKLRGPADIFQLFDVQIFVCSEEGGARGDVVGGAMGYGNLGICLLSSLCLPTRTAGECRKSQKCRKVWLRNKKFWLIFEKVNILGLSIFGPKSDLTFLWSPSFEISWASGPLLHLKRFLNPRIGRSNSSKASYYQLQIPDFNFSAANITQRMIALA